MNIYPKGIFCFIRYVYRKVKDGYCLFNEIIFLGHFFSFMHFACMKGKITKIKLFNIFFLRTIEDMRYRFYRKNSVFLYCILYGISTHIKRVQGENHFFYEKGMSPLIILWFSRQSSASSLKHHWMSYSWVMTYYTIHICVPNSWYISLHIRCCEIPYVRYTNPNGILFRQNL